MKAHRKIKQMIDLTPVPTGREEDTTFLHILRILGKINDNQVVIQTRLAVLEDKLANVKWEPLPKDLPTASPDAV